MTVRTLKFISRHLWLSSVLALVVLAFSMTLARIALPMLQDYRDDVAAELAKRVQREVSIEAFDIAWRGLGPRILLHDVRLLADDGRSTLLGFQSAHLDIDLWASLLAGQWHVGRLSLNGVELQLLRHEDGRLSLAGVSAGTAASGGGAADGGDAALTWLLSQGQLQMLDSVIHWRDMRRAEVLKFHDVNLQLDNSAGQHRLSGHLSLPSSHGDRLSFAIDLRGQDIHLAELTGQAYLKGRGLRLARLLSDVGGTGVMVDGGLLDAQLWLEMEAGVVQSVRGKVDGDELHALGAEGESVSLEALYGEFAWMRRNYGWALEVDRLRPRVDGVAWPATRMSVHYANGEQGRHIELASDFIQLEDVAKISLLLPQLPDKLRQLVRDTRPRGHAAQTYLSVDLSPHEDEAPRYFLSSQLDALGLQAANGLPGFDGLNGHLNMSHDGGVLELSSRGGFFDSQGLFRDYIAVERMDGRLDWRQRDDGWHVFIDDLAIDNDDLSTLSRGSLHFPNDGRRPIVSLFSRFSDGDGSHTSRYLPVKVMPEKTVAWLDRAIKDARVSSGAMILYGALDRFPFDDGSGRFEIRFDVENGLLDYADEWPPLANIDAEVLFHGRSMTIFGQRARLLDSQVEEVEVKIADLLRHPRVLEVAGDVRGDAADVLRVLTESPLRSRFAAFLGEAQGQGDSWLELDFSLPLAGGAPTVAGRLQLTDASLDFKGFGVDLTAMNGVLGFTDQGLNGQGIEAVIMGQPAYVSVETRQEDDAAILAFSAHGDSRLQALAARQPLPVYQYLSGEAPWQASLQVATVASGPEPRLTLESDLEGIAIDLPPPLNKAATAMSPLLLQAEFLSDSSRWQLNYDQRLFGAFELPHGKTPGRASLALGTKALLPGEPGMRVLVRQPEMDLIPWLDWLQNDAPGSDEGGDSAPGMAVNWLELDVDVAQLAAYTLHGLQTQGVRRADAWHLQVSSAETVGAIRLPFQKGAALEFDFERLVLLSDQSEASADEAAPSALQSFDPAQLPPLRVRSDYFHFENMNFGVLELRSSPRKQGLSLERLRLTSSAADIELKGSWTKLAARHSAGLNGRLNIHDFGDFQSHLGYLKSIEDGEGVIDVALTWPSPLLDPQFEVLRGTVKVNIEDGRLLDVEPGAGRLLGMFGLSTLSRRMTLDFSDIFSQGFAFDEMRGSFAVADGSAYTRNAEGAEQPLMIKGPAASIELRGRAGFVARDYDQHVSVTPHVTANLPLWGAVAGGLGTGAAVLLVERLLRSKIDDATRFYYHISGDWDQPQMVAVDEKGQSLQPLPKAP